MLGMNLQDLVFAMLNLECAVTPSWKSFFVELCVGSMYFVSIDKRSIVKRLLENQKDCVYTFELF